MRTATVLAVGIVATSAACDDHVRLSLLAPAPELEPVAGAGALPLDPPDQAVVPPAFVDVPVETRTPDAEDDPTGSDPREPTTSSVTVEESEDVPSEPVEPELPEQPEPEPGLATAALVLRYDFSGTGTEVEDLAGSANAVALGGAELDGQGSLELDGDDDYVDMPNGIVSQLESATIVAWLEWYGGVCWQRVFDFGSNDRGEDRVGFATSSLFMTPAACPGLVLTSKNEFTRNSGSESYQLVAPRGLPENRASQVALVFDGERNVVSMYMDGVLVARNATRRRLADIDDVNNWLGRSQWVQDRNLRARYDELRIYSVALDDAEIATLHDRGPDEL